MAFLIKKELWFSKKLLSSKECLKTIFIKILDIAIEGKKRCKMLDYLNGINKKELISKVLK